VRRVLRHAGRLALLGVACLVGTARGAGDPTAAGAYCPLPPPGETPHCLEPAKRAYGEFFTALEEGVPADAATGRVEADLAAGVASGNAYLALSSLAYGYWRLSERAAAEQADPALALRLERWNALLREAYAASAQDSPYRAAIREAAHDLRRRAPPVRLRCVDADGTTSECDSTEAVLRGIDTASAEVGLRGALERLLERMFGDQGS
jgi:hypothetical protein